MKLHMGFDIGSTTVKLVALNEEYKIVYSTYQRHFSDVKKTIIDVLKDCYDLFKDNKITINVTGSGGLSVHEFLGIEFVQEVIAATEAITRFIPRTDVAIELGGEDSKITYLKGSLEQRMNSICAGGTGAFIDQMASLLQTDAQGLNELAEDYKKIYPIASRCGVFAKTDIQALINQGASKNDIAASVFQSVVNQTISNLACGRPIRGNIAFLGGPLYFLPNLKKRFVETLKLTENEIISPENSQLFVALGAALLSVESEEIEFSKLYERAIENKNSEVKISKSLEPLFNSEEELKEFREKHKSKELRYRDLKGYRGPVFMGIDAGSTTLKIILLSENNEILYTHYGSNKGKPLEIISEKLKEIYKTLDGDAWIASAGVTGYGEDLIKAALNLDFGEVETIAHFRAAKFFDEKVDFILDIGGQDMKSMKIESGVIESILLNEACSSGCGSFLESFAHSLNMSVEEFSNKALLAKNPVDLGSRCTVFMNSNVKQAQKEGAEVGDIAAGLAYSVIKNAIQKVIKVRDPKELGTHIVVQGGTFYGEAVLRAFEKITGREVVRPSIAGLMGALGICLIAKEKSTGVSTIINNEDLKKFNYENKITNCRQCSNSCTLNVHIFSNGQRFISGNRCEKGAGIVKTTEELPNLYKYKYERIFDYESLTEKEAERGVVGIPRVLNIYENYPFWHTFFTNLGYRVVLSDKSTREIYEKGMESIISETACYPAKIVHGHIENLVEKGIDFIFYPSVFYEEKEYKNAHNTLNCPVVAGYSEVIKNNVDSIKENNVKFLNPFISFDDRVKLEIRLAEVFPNIEFKKVAQAVKNAYEEQDRYREDVSQMGLKALKEIEEKGVKCIVLAGRPYHIDPEINHGISELINSLGVAVISEDSISSEVELSGKVRVLDQWNYHSRLYRAAKFVGQRENLEMVQLNSFGCGIDAVTTDQVNEILAHYNKIYTVIKIDEVNNLGAIKIRLRSLIEAVEKREHIPVKEEYTSKPLIYSKEMAKTHTLLLPQMAPIHFELISAALRSEDIKVEILENTGAKVVDLGLKYVNNDACYPSLFVVGQFIDALKSGKYDTDNLTLVMAQTGGACRASNYVGFIRKALADAGYGHVPVLGLSAQGIEKHEGLKFPIGKLKKIAEKTVKALLYGDLLMRVSNSTRPYEKNKGITNKITDKWLKICSNFDYSSSRKDFEEMVYKIILDFNSIDRVKELKPRVGIVGEILVKYLPAANNNLQDYLEKEGAEVVISDLTDFLMYCLRNTKIKRQKLSKGIRAELMANISIAYIEYYRNVVRKALEETKFGSPKKIDELAEMAEEFVDLSNQYGEGWLLTGEMVELIKDDAPNIVCVQPFGCLPNHITGKGVIKAIREKYPIANIVPIDFDASASEVNQFNRIKLMLSQANKNLSTERSLSKEELLGRNRVFGRIR